MSDLEVWAKVQAVERLKSAEARLADAKQAIETFDPDVTLTALKEQLQTAYENALRECQLAKDDADAARVDEDATAAITAILVEPPLDIRLKG